MKMWWLTAGGQKDVGTAILASTIPKLKTEIKPVINQNLHLTFSVKPQDSA